MLEGVPAGLPLSEDEINAQLARRQRGYGRGGSLFFGFYGAPYVYGPSYYYDPYYAPSCDPAGYYDQWGYWHAYPGCYADPYGYYGY